MKHVAIWVFSATVIAACAPQATSVPRPSPDASAEARPLEAPIPAATLAGPAGNEDAAAGSDVRAAVADEPGSEPETAPTLTDFLPRDTAGLSDLERLAWEAWARMEVGRFLDGRYDTLALTELELPRGVRWTVLSLEGDAYVLSITSDAANTPLRVSETGVEQVR